MIRAGISLPALMQLMGHAQIQTTMVYVRITPQDVYQQYVRAVAQLVRPAATVPLMNRIRLPLVHPLAEVFFAAIQSVTTSMSDSYQGPLSDHGRVLSPLSG